MSNSISSKIFSFLLILILLSLVGSNLSLSLAAPRSQSIQSMDGIQIALQASDTSISSWTPPPESFSQIRPQSATFNVTYVGSWSSAARNAFQHAMNIWATQVNSTVPIEIVAEWKPLGEGFLVQGGPNRFFVNFSGAPIANTWYPVTLANKLAGTDLMPEGPDINVAINSNFNWYFGTDGNTPSSQFDLVTSGLAGLGFGLGFFSSMNVSNGQGNWGWNTGHPYIFDRHVINGSGQNLINTGLFPNPSSALASQLTSNNIYFNGSNARTANGGTNVKLFAPSTWRPGLSISHLDENTYPPGTSNSLMTPYLNYGEAIHNPGSVTRGILRDMGWSTDTIPPSPEVRGDLQLHMLDALPPNMPIRPSVTVLNENPTPANYTVVTQLWRGFGMLAERRQDISFSWSGRQTLTFDFGIYSPGNYSNSQYDRQGQG